MPTLIPPSCPPIAQETALSEMLPLSQLGSPKPPTAPAARLPAPRRRPTPTRLAAPRPPILLPALRVLLLLLLAVPLAGSRPRSPQKYSPPRARFASLPALLLAAAALPAHPALAAPSPRPWTPARAQLRRRTHAHHAHHAANASRHDQHLNSRWAPPAVLSPQAHKRTLEFTYKPLAAVYSAIDPADPFSVPIATDAPPASFARKPHPLAAPQTLNHNAIPTNKFYTNWLLADPALPVYAAPYVLRLLPHAQTQHPIFAGLAVDVANASGLVQGPLADTGAATYLYPAAGPAPVVLGAAQFAAAGAALHLQAPQDMAVQAYLVPADDASAGAMWVPVVQGTGFITAVYDALTPQITSVVGFANFSETSFDSAAAASSAQSIRKYHITLTSGARWYAYLSLTSTADRSSETLLPQLVLNGSAISCPDCPSGAVLQVAAGPPGADRFLDRAAGRFHTGARVAGSYPDAGSSTARFRIQYDAQGASAGATGLVYAAAHHRQALVRMAPAQVTAIQLWTPALGKLVGMLADALEFHDTVPAGIDMLPYNEVGRSGTRDGVRYLRSREGVEAIYGEYPDSWGSDAESRASTQAVSAWARAKIVAAGWHELNTTDWAGTCAGDSVYSSGKVLDKLAHLVLAAWYIAEDAELAGAALGRLTSALETWVSQAAAWPLVYDTTWGGVVTGAAWSDAYADYGAGYYNDHHFHYGYVVHAAAVAGRVDAALAGRTEHWNGTGEWAQTHRGFFDALVRDVANPSAADAYFPRWRAFDWYAGHSWAKGLFASSDGRDEESSSEDVHFAYAAKMWGDTVGDAALAARSAIMLSVLKRALNTYMLYGEAAGGSLVVGGGDAGCAPAAMARNLVSGILFENKVSYTTYFGTNVEYIHGIHMLPVTSVSAYIRSAAFVRREWEDRLAAVAPGLESGWKSVLYFNKGIEDAAESWAFFCGETTQGEFRESYLDNGLSRTWGLAYSAYVGGF